jgi:hypothetical protein
VPGPNRKPNLPPVAFGPAVSVIDFRAMIFAP